METMLTVLGVVFYLGANIMMMKFDAGSIRAFYQTQGWKFGIFFTVFGLVLVLVVVVLFVLIPAIFPAPERKTTEEA